MRIRAEPPSLQTQRPNPRSSPLKTLGGKTQASLQTLSLWRRHSRASPAPVTGNSHLSHSSGTGSRCRERNRGFLRDSNSFSALPRRGRVENTFDLSTALPYSPPLTEGRTDQFSAWQALALQLSGSFPRAHFGYTCESPRASLGTMVNTLQGSKHQETPVI